MVRCRVNGEHPIRSRWKTGGKIGRDSASSIQGQVQAFEEGELGRISRFGIIKTINLLNHQMRVSDEDTLIVHLGRSTVVVRIGVDECTSLKVLDLERGSEGLVGRDRAEVDGEHELGRRDIGLCNDTSLGNWVARSSSDLLSIGERNAVEGSLDNA
jgi:hypothetical protein